MTFARFLALTLAFLALAASGGFVASGLPVPLPWMTGSLVCVATMVALAGAYIPKTYVFPQTIRRGSTAIIGVAIGAQVTVALLAELPGLAISILALLPFVLLAQGGNYLIFRRIGGYDRALAFYAGAPGGLIEAIAMGEAAGAEMRRLTAQQFLRLIIVLIAVPAGLSLWLGTPVGSAAGLSFGPGAPVTFWTLVWLVGVSVAGLAFGKVAHLPAGQITGPLVLSAGVAVVLAPGFDVPGPILNAAQVGVGASLGLHFLGITGRMVRQAIGLATLSCAYMFVLTVGFAITLSQLVPLTALEIVAAFAPGGVTEMSLVALSLGSATAIVTLHHLIRITLTVTLLPVLWRWLNTTYPVGRD